MVSLALLLILEMKVGAGERVLIGVGRLFVWRLSSAGVEVEL